MSKESYSTVIEQSSKPALNREAISRNRHGEPSIPRKHHMSYKEVETLIEKMKDEKSWINPYRFGGSYWGICKTLTELGLDIRHPFSDFMKKMEEVMSKPCTQRAGSVMTSWDRFVKRRAKSISKENARDLLTKIVGNIEVLQRLYSMNPYGLKLLQVGGIINMYEDGDDIYVELVTGTIEGNPINQRRKQRSKPAIDISSLGVPYCVIDAKKITDGNLKIIGSNIEI